LFLVSKLHSNSKSTGYAEGRNLFTLPVQS
jgi:hypothetical protein